MILIALIALITPSPLIILSRLTLDLSRSTVDGRRSTVDGRQQKPKAEQKLYSPRIVEHDRWAASASGRQARW